MGVLVFRFGVYIGETCNGKKDKCDEMVSWKFGNGLDQENGNGIGGTMAMEMDFELFTR
jgi:hypothetical protein